MLGCPANKALITGINLVVSAFLIALLARLWVPAVNMREVYWTTNIIIFGHRVWI